MLSCRVRHFHSSLGTECIAAPDAAWASIVFDRGSSADHARKGCLSLPGELSQCRRALGLVFAAKIDRHDTVDWES